MHRIRHPGDTGAEQGADNAPEAPVGLAARWGAPDCRQIVAGPRWHGHGNGTDRPWWNSVILQPTSVFRDGAVGRTRCAAAAPQ